MHRAMTLLRELCRDEGGSTAIEYGFIGLLISIIIVGSVTTMGSKISSKWMGPIAGNL